jgi:hypothetical protein
MVHDIQNVRFEVFRAVTMKNAVFRDVMPCGCCKNWHFISSVLWLLVTANIVLSSPMLVTQIIEAVSSSETSVLQEPHGETSQNTSLFSTQNYCCFGLSTSPGILKTTKDNMSYPYSCSRSRWYAEWSRSNEEGKDLCSANTQREARVSESSHVQKIDILDNLQN